MVNPAAFAPFNLGEIMERGQRRQMNDLRIEEYRTERENKKRLSELLPGAVKGDRDSIDQLYQVNPEFAMKLDEHQRKQARAELEDLSSAVRWADTPEKWQQVQQFYGKHADLTPYTFENRERALMSLGLLGKYLEDAPKPEYRTVEAGGSLIDVSGGNPRVVIAPNPGGKPLGSPVEQAGPTPPLPPGFVLDGGPTASQSGGFPY